MQGKRIFFLVVLIAVVATVMAQSGKKYNINVKTISGSTEKAVPLEVKASDTVLDLKNKVKAKENIPPRRQTCTFDGQVLDDHRSLADYNIVKGSSVRCTIRAPSV